MNYTLYICLWAGQAVTKQVYLAISVMRYGNYHTTIPPWVFLSFLFPKAVSMDIVLLKYGSVFVIWTRPKPDWIYCSTLWKPISCRIFILYDQLFKMSPIISYHELLLSFPHQCLPDSPEQRQVWRSAVLFPSCCTVLRPGFSFPSLTGQNLIMLNVCLISLGNFSESLSQKIQGGIQVSYAVLLWQAL